MRTELVSIPTDTIPVDGAYYTPDEGPVKGAALFMHGVTMNFYTGASRFLPPHLIALGYACLAFNRRGHDVLTTRGSYVVEGGAYQTAAEALADNEYAAGFLADRGFTAPIPIGHSNGGMLAAQFGARHPEIPALVLLSAHGGGKDTVPLACKAGSMAADRMDEMIAEAERLVAAGRGRDLMLMPGFWRVISAESFLDRLHNTPDTVEAAPHVKCPTLFIRGDKENPSLYPAEEFQRRAGGPCEVIIVEDCDHFYSGKEAVVSKIVTGWLERTLTSKG